MSRSDRSVSLKPNPLMRCQARPLTFEKKSASSLQDLPGATLSMRISGTTFRASVELRPSRRICVTAEGSFRLHASSGRGRVPPCVLCMSGNDESNTGCNYPEEM
jgi:hypothetical protein